MGVARNRSRAGAVLVRPDGYVLWAGERIERELAVERLRDEVVRDIAQTLRQNLRNVRCVTVQPLHD